MSAFAHSFLAAFAAMWSQVGFSSCSVDQCIAEWNDGAGNVVAGTDATLTAGTGTHGSTPANLAWVLSWRLAARYRGGHPRTYLAGIDAIELLDNVSFKPGSVTTLQGLANTFLGAINALTPAPFSSVTLGVLRQFANGGSTKVPPIFLDPPQFKPFQSVVVKPGIATQRRRLGDNFS